MAWRKKELLKRTATRNFPWPFSGKPVSRSAKRPRSFTSGRRARAGLAIGGETKMSRRAHHCRKLKIARDIVRDAIGSRLERVPTGVLGIDGLDIVAGEIAEATPATVAGRCPLAPGRRFAHAESAARSLRLAQSLHPPASVIPGYKSGRCEGMPRLTRTRPGPPANPPVLSAFQRPAVAVRLIPVAPFGRGAIGHPADFRDLAQRIDPGPQSPRLRRTGGRLLCLGAPASRDAVRGGSALSNEALPGLSRLIVCHAPMMASTRLQRQRHPAAISAATSLSA